MKSGKASLLSQRSGDGHSLKKTFSIQARTSHTIAPAAPIQRTPPLTTATSLKQAPSLESRALDAAVQLETPDAVMTRNETSDLMERFQRAMTQVRGERGLGSVDVCPSPPRAHKDTPKETKTTKHNGQETALTKGTSRNFSEVLSNASRRASDTASLWMRKTTSCITGGGSLDNDMDELHVKCDRRPSEDILLMVQEQRRRYDDAVRHTKSEIRITQRRNEFLRSQLEAIKKTHPKEKPLMRAVDELDAMVAAARRFELKLQSLKEEEETLRRKVFSNQSAQQALESLGGQKLTIQDDAWHRDLDIFSKLAYAGLLKGNLEA